MSKTYHLGKAIFVKNDTAYYKWQHKGDNWGNTLYATEQELLDMGAVEVPEKTKEECDCDCHEYDITTSDSKKHCADCITKPSPEIELTEEIEVDGWDNLGSHTRDILLVQKINTMIYQLNANTKAIEEMKKGE